MLMENGGGEAVHEGSRSVGLGRCGLTPCRSGLVPGSPGIATPTKRLAIELDGVS